MDKWLRLVREVVPICSEEDQVRLYTRWVWCDILLPVHMLLGDGGMGVGGWGDIRPHPLSFFFLFY